jgi:prepilin-type N-terminal cleavage/methylation domain-containing protein
MLRKAINEILIPYCRLNLKKLDRKISGCTVKSVCITEKGFTLLEVLLAFFIFSILFITIYTSYSGSFKTIEMTENRMELYRKAAIVLERISEDLQSSYMSVLPPNSFGQPAEYTQFLGEDSDINGQNANTLNFFSRVPPLFSEEDETVSGQLISYSVIQGSEENELVLLRSENPEFIDETEDRVGLTLSDGLQAINFTYFDDAGEPYESWDSDSEEFAGRLPRMVSVSLEFLNYENPEAPLKVMTSVVLPVNYLPRL